MTSHGLFIEFGFTRFLYRDLCPRIPDLRTYQATMKHFIVRFGDGGSEKLKWAPVSNKGLEII